MKRLISGFAMAAFALGLPCAALAQTADPATPSAVTVAAPAPPALPANLNPDLAAAIAGTRAIETEAQSARAAAEEAERLALAAAERARTGLDPLAMVTTTPSGASYAGETALGTRNGHGVHTFPGETPDTFAGQWVAGQREGVGVYRWALPAGPKAPARFAGTYLAGARNGPGVQTLQDGETVAARFDANGPVGPAVRIQPDGSRLEGEWANGQLNGYAIVWSPSGQMQHAGRWTNGLLAENLAPPPPSRRR